MAADYLDHYRAKGFPVALPERRLTVVILDDDRSFAAYSGNKGLRMVPRRTDPAPSIHGYFSRKDNRLQIFDHRSLGPQLAARPGYENLRTLAHELTHQLTFNTGLLDRRGDVPACVVEGLAMYGEVRKLTGRTAPGQINRMRIDNLAAMQRRRIPWIPVAQLLADDHHVGNAATHEGLLAYAESWLLVDYLMMNRSRSPVFGRPGGDPRSSRWQVPPRRRPAAPGGPGPPGRGPATLLGAPPEELAPAPGNERRLRARKVMHGSRSGLGGTTHRAFPMPVGGAHPTKCEPIARALLS